MNKLMRFTSRISTQEVEGSPWLRKYMHLYHRRLEVSRAEGRRYPINIKLECSGLWLVAL